MSKCINAFQFFTIKYILHIFNGHLAGVFVAVRSCTKFEILYEKSLSTFRYKNKCICICITCKNECAFIYKNK